MRKLLPDSLFGRLLLLLLLGLSVVAMGSAWIVLGERGHLLHRVSALHAAQGIAGLARLLDAMPEAERRRLVAALDLRPLGSISLDEPPLADTGAMAPEAPVLASLLRGQLGAGFGVRAAIFDPEHPRVAAGPGWHGMGRRGMRPRAFQVQVRLADGRIVTFRQLLPEGIFDRPYRLWVALALLLLSVALLAVVGASWLTRPLKRLAGAASAFGRDVGLPPLPVSGPREVREASIAFNQMQADIRGHLQDRSRFLAAVSHDLKTPITRLRLRTEMLDDVSQRQGFETDLRDMEELVLATLEYMRSGDDNGVPESVDLRILLEELVAEAAATGAVVRLDAAADLRIAGRPLALRRIFRNLLNNALTYAGEATVTLRTAGQGAVVCVLDRGPGIPQALLERVFEPFFRLEESRNRHTGGTGLGLAVARNLARAQGGDIRLENRRHGGLRACVFLSGPPA